MPTPGGKEKPGKYFLRGALMLLIPVATIWVRTLAASDSQNSLASLLSFLSGALGILGSICAVLASLGWFAAGIGILWKNARKTG
jgi:hypothetical protein